jgi:hypothetical protein
MISKQSFSMLICTLVGAPAEVIAYLQDQEAEQASCRTSSPRAVQAAIPLNAVALAGVTPASVQGVRRG